MAQNQDFTWLNKILFDELRFCVISKDMILTGKKRLYY